MKQKQHYTELTVLSGIAILFVLGIHGCGSALNRFYSGTANYADTGVLLRWLSNLAAPAVPMFLFASGFKYAANDTQTPYLAFLKKRLPRVLMSFAIINTIFWALDSAKYMDSFDLILLAKTYLSSWLGNTVAYQLWYIPMYCFVIILCPLARRLIPSTRLRFILYALVGITQRLLELRFSVLGTYPIRFISYPVFFEMGVFAQEQNWRSETKKIYGIFIAGAYVLAVLALSWITPVFSTHGMTKYILYYYVGTAVMFLISCVLKNSRLLQWLGMVSYPVFLLHEPLIGGLVRALLSKCSVITEFDYAICWTIFVFMAAVLIMQIIKRVRLDEILWEFMI